VPPALVWLPSDDATAERTEWCRLFAFALRGKCALQARLTRTDWGCPATLCVRKGL